MSNIITHMDADGVISAYLIVKYVEKPKRIYFSNPSIIKDSIAKSILGEDNLDKLYILDIGGNEIALRLAAVYNRTIWIDHHQWAPIKHYDNVEIHIAYEPSAAAVIGNLYMIFDNMIEVANNLDQNKPSNVREIKFRDMISALRFYKGRAIEYALENLVYKMAEKDIDRIIEENNELIESFIDEIKKLENEIKANTKKFIIKDYKVTVIETKANIPVYKIQEIIDDDWDILVVKFTRFNREFVYTKLEFRSKGPDILKVAIPLGGGGHIKAAGASLKGIITLDQLLSALNIFL
ncbi:MAG: DHH family phosphoesterase [Thermoplasmata archaeon]